MGAGLLIILLFVVIFFYILPRILPSLLQWYLKRKVRKFTEQMTGAAPKSDSRKSRQAKKEKPKSTKPNGKIIPKEYGVDVEYTEIHSYSEDIEVTTDSKGNTKIKVEEQISDAEWVEIKE